VSSASRRFGGRVIAPGHGLDDGDGSRNAPRRQQDYSRHEIQSASGVWAATASDNAVTDVATLPVVSGLE
jgi:hypothetical protein